MRNVLTGLFKGIFALCFAFCSTQAFASSSTSSSSSSSSNSCASRCDPCGSLSSADCKVKKGCISIPARQQEYFVGDPTCSTQIETVPAAQIYYRMQGKFESCKPTIVFIQGFAETGEIWRCAQEELCDCYCTVAIDLRGNGRSSKTPASPQPGGIHYNLQLNVDDIFEVLTRLGITENIILVGHSLGCNYCIAYNAQHQDQVAKLVLVSGFPFIVPACATDPNCDPNCYNPATCEQGFCYPYGIPPAGVQFLTQPLISCLAGGGSEAQCLNQWGSFLAPIWYNEPCQIELQNAQAGLVAAVSSMTVPIVSSIFGNAVTEDIRPLFADVIAPTLICYGSSDLAVNPGSSQFLHDNIANSVLAEFVGKGHQLHVTDYKNFDQLLEDFAGACQFPDFTKVFNQGCCICPKAGPVDYASQSCDVETPQQTPKKGK